MRPSRAELITPKPVLVMSVCTLLNCGWLSTLNDSSRNWRLVPLPSPKFLKSEKSTFVVVGTAKDVAPRVAEHAEPRLGEGVGVEPLVDAAAARVLITHQVGPVRAERVVQAAEVVGLDCQRETPLPGDDAVHLPAADDRVLHARRISAVAFARAERQVVDEAADHAVVHVEIREAVIAIRIPVVEESLPAVEPGCADAGRGRLGIGALRPRVGEREQRAAPAVLELRVQGVVVRAPAPVAVDVDDEVRIRPPLLDGQGFAGSIEERLRDVLPHQQVGALVADVVHLQDRRAGQLALHAERPLLHVRIPRLWALAHRQERVGGRCRDARRLEAWETGHQWSGAAPAVRATADSCRGSRTDTRPRRRRSHGPPRNRRTGRSRPARRSSRR